MPTSYLSLDSTFAFGSVFAFSSFLFWDSTFAFLSSFDFSSDFFNSADFLSSFLPLCLDYKFSLSNFTVFGFLCFLVTYFIIVFFYFFGSYFSSFALSGISETFVSGDTCFISFGFSGVLAFVSEEEGFGSVDTFLASFDFSGIVAFGSVDNFLESFTYSEEEGFSSVDPCFDSFGFSGKDVDVGGIAGFFLSYLSGNVSNLPYLIFSMSGLDVGVVLVSCNSTKEKVSRRDGETMFESKRVNIKFFIFIFSIN